MGGVSDEILLARAFLSRVAEPACIPLWDLVRTRGPVEAVRELRTGSAAPELHSAVAARLNAADPYDDLEAAERHGVRLVVPEADDWPHFAMAGLERTGIERLERWKHGQRRHEDHGEPIPPLALWVRGPGDLSALATRSISIVGARAATPYGQQVAGELAHGVARRGFAVVSGGAFGIDAVAHRSALACGALTVLVTAGGADRAYPLAHASLFDRVAESGLIVSESPPGAAPHRRRFLTRNRIVAALGTGSLIVEASQRSGAMNTAGHCQRLDRPLMVVPGPVTSKLSAGCHELLREPSRGALLVTCVADVLAAIGSSSDLAADTPEQGRTADPVRLALDETDSVSRQLYDGFPTRRAVRPAELAFATGLSERDVIGSLPLLEVVGLIEEVPNGFRRARLRPS